MILKVVYNIGMYLQKDEIKTPEEYSSFQRSENLIVSILDHLCNGSELSPFARPDTNADEFFGVFFMDEEIPEDIKTELSNVERTASDTSFDSLGVTSLLLNDLLAYKTILPYVTEALKRNSESFDLVGALLSLLRTPAGPKVDYESV
jgi:hypothetical protein